MGKHRRKALLVVALVVAAVLVLGAATSRPAHALVMSVDPPEVVGLFLNPDDSNQVVITLRLPGHFDYRPGEVIALESADGGKSFLESNDPGRRSPLVEQALADSTAGVPTQERKRQFSQAIDRAMNRAYALDTEAYLQRYPALNLKRSTYWTPLFVVLGLLSLIVPISISRQSLVVRFFAELPTSVVLLLLAYGALTFMTGLRDCLVDLKSPTFPFFGVALRCATQPLALAALFLPVTLLLPSSRLAVTENRWLPAPLQRAVTFAWPAVAIAFWLAGFLLTIWSAMHLV